jgi:hypothetical protein
VPVSRSGAGGQISFRLRWWRCLRRLTLLIEPALPTRERFTVFRTLMALHLSLATGQRRLDRREAMRNPYDVDFQAENRRRWRVLARPHSIGA